MDIQTFNARKYWPAQERADAANQDYCEAVAGICADILLPLISGAMDSATKYDHVSTKNHLSRGLAVIEEMLGDCDG